MESNFSLLSLFTGDWMTVFVSIVLLVFSVLYCYCRENKIMACK